MGGFPRTRRRSVHDSRNLSRAPAASLRDRLRRPLTEPVCRMVRQQSGSGEGTGEDRALSRRREDAGDGDQNQALTATVTATAAANGCQQRPATAHNSRAIYANWGYVRPEKQTVGDQRRGAATVAKPLNNTRRTWTTLEYRPSPRPVTDGPGRLAHSYGSEGPCPLRARAEEPERTATVSTGNASADPQVSQSAGDGCSATQTSQADSADSFRHPLLGGGAGRLRTITGRRRAHAEERTRPSPRRLGRRRADN